MIAPRVTAILSLCAWLLGAAAPPLYAALSLTNLGNYTQNFDTLGTTGTGLLWTNNVTITGWYWQTESSGARQPYDATDGSNFTGAVYSYGKLNSGDSLDHPLTDRAMGSLTTNGSDSVWGIVFQNNALSGETITEITVTYAGEQWQRQNATTDRLTFSYRTSSSDITTLNPTGGAVPTSPAWTAVSALDFVQKHSATGSTALDGNATANRTILSTTISGISVASGQYLALRWHDGDVTNSDQGLSIDDLTVSFQTATVPEPSAFLFGALVCGLIGAVVGGRRLVAKQWASS